MIFAALLMTVVSVPPFLQNVADWECAEPLIEKNHARPVRADLLARRIADECASPLILSTLAQQMELLRLTAESIYQTEVSLFTSEILRQISQRRLRHEIDLVR